MQWDKFGGHQNPRQQHGWCWEIWFRIENDPLLKIQNRRWPPRKKDMFLPRWLCSVRQTCFQPTDALGGDKEFLLHWKIGWGACAVSTGGKANKNATIFETTPTRLISLKQHTSDAPWGKATNPECLVVQGLFNFDLLLTQANAGVEIRGK